MRLVSKLCRVPKKLFFKFTIRRESPKWYIRDTCGQVCAFITWLLIFYGQFVVFYIIIPPWYQSDNINLENLAKKYIDRNDNFFSSQSTGNNLKTTNDLLNIIYNSNKPISNKDMKEISEINNSNLFYSSNFKALFNGLIFFILSIFAFVSHCRAMFTDPGSTEKNNASPEAIAKMNLPSGHVLYKCTKCAAIKPERAHHCSVCRRCINKMDHHCPWINNCVGEKNQKYFVLFTLYICLISGHALFLVIHRFITCSNYSWKSPICSIRPPGITIINLIGLIFEAALFCLFTAIMFGSQLYSICVDETGIEQLKGSSSHKQNKRKNRKFLNFKAVFGDKFSYHWIIPFFEPKWAKTDVSLYAV